MAVQSDTKRVIDSAPAQQQVDVLAQIADQVAQDSQSNPEQYIEETTTPRGGE